MTEEISTTPEVSQEQTTLETPQEQISESPVESTQEPEIEKKDGTETAEQKEETTEPKPTDWEKIAKDHQASFTKSQQELADLRKQVEELKQPKEPKLIDETGNISNEFRQQHQFEVDNNEFIAYENISRGINDMTTRVEVENLLREAQSVYLYDKNAYSQVMDRVKEYFAPSVVEKMTKDKILAEQQFEQKYKTELQKDIQEKASRVSKKIESVPELYQLVDEKSENFSPETFTIVKQLFDKYGDIDTDMTLKAISSIKALGVKEHLAKQELEATKLNASVSTGSNVKEVKNDLPTAQQLAEKPEIYTEMCKKFGMDKIDAIIAGKST